MKKFFILILTISAIIALSFPTVALAFSATVLDNPTYTVSEDGFVYKETSVLEGSSTRKIFYGEYNPTLQNSKYEFVLHSIRSGSKTTLTTVLNIAKNYEETTGRKVIMATNGDYFDFNTGANMESYVNDGIVISKGSYITKHCIGFDNNGMVAIGRMTQVETRLVVYYGGERYFFNIDKFNSQPSEGEIAIYNTAGTHTVANAGVVLVKTSTATLTNYPVYGTDNTTVDRKVQESKTFTLKSSQYAVVFSAEYAEFFTNNKMYGSEIDLVETPAGDFLGCNWVVGGYDILINNGVVGTSFHTDNGGSDLRARTFIGFKEDGSCFLCVVDETGGSTGINVTQEAQLASVLGAKYALELDGGGSSTMVLRVDDQLTVRNKSIDGANMRAVSNAVLLVEKEDQPQQEQHTCQHVCDICGKCTDTNCTDAVCAEKCQGHQTEIQHVCQHVCDICGKCTDINCTDAVCAEKCQGHQPQQEQHVCQHVCNVCGKCTDKTCADDACSEKCQGHSNDNVSYTDLYIGLGVCGVVVAASIPTTIILIRKKRLGGK